MSGGAFNYVNYNISDIADQIEELIQKNKSNELNQWGDPVGNHFKPETIEEFKKAVVVLRQAAVYAQRIDYLVSADDSEKTFHERLAEDLAKIIG